MKAFASVIQLNDKFYRSLYTKSTFHFPPPALPVCSVIQKQAGCLRLFSDIFSSKRAST